MPQETNPLFTASHPCYFDLPRGKGQWRTEGWGVLGVQPSPRNFEVLTKLSRNSLKVPKIKKILLYEMKFRVPNYSSLQNP
jgi:hypothetical protein